MCLSYFLSWFIQFCTFATNASRNCVNQSCRIWESKTEKKIGFSILHHTQLRPESSLSFQRRHVTLENNLCSFCGGSFGASASSHSVQVPMDAHFMGISASVCNDTHRTCNAQQLRMDFRQTDWPNANGIKSEIRGTHQNNLTAKMLTGDSAKPEIHSLVCALRSP